MTLCPCLHRFCVRGHWGPGPVEVLQGAGDEQAPDAVTRTWLQKDSVDLRVAHMVGSLGTGEAGTSQ